MRETQRMVQGLVVWDCRRERYYAFTSGWTDDINEAWMRPNTDRNREHIHYRTSASLGHDDFEVYLVYGWAEGMVDHRGRVAVETDDPADTETHYGVELDGCGGTLKSYLALPDIEHPATKGWLLDQARRALAVVFDENAAGELHAARFIAFSGRARWACRCWSEEYDALRGQTASDTEGAAIARALLWAFDRLEEQEAG